MMICICIYMYMYIRTCHSPGCNIAYTDNIMSRNRCARECTHTHMYTCVHIYMFICVYAHIYICVYACVCVCVCIYIYICYPPPPPGYPPILGGEEGWTKWSVWRATVRSMATRVTFLVETIEMAHCPGCDASRPIRGECLVNAKVRRGLGLVPCLPKSPKAIHTLGKALQIGSGTLIDLYRGLLNL